MVNSQTLRLRAREQSTIEKGSQVPEIQELVECLNNLAERPGYGLSISITRATTDAYVASL
jgi:hypothetical protein